VSSSQKPATGYIHRHATTRHDELRRSPAVELRAGLGQTLPALLGALVILFAGYLLAKVLEKLTERGLRRIRLNHLLERGGVTQAVERSGTHVNPTRVLANLVFWLVMFTVILLAAMR